jgi:glycosyltransferase involved in cell wall biosynthesis
LRILIVHNEYRAFSGEEQALRTIARLFEENSHQIDWFLKSSAHIEGGITKVRAFFSGLHSPASVKELRSFLKQHTFDVALVQNLYPFLSPSVIPVLREFNIPVVMRCPNYRLLCPTGLHLYKNSVCEQCLGGREYWCVLKNCENNLFKSLGYALRNAAARISRRVLDYVNVFVVLSEFQRQRFIAGGIPPERIDIVPNIAPSSVVGWTDKPGELVSFVGRVSPEKGIADFIEAAAQLPQIPFAVAGNYQQMPGIDKKAPANVQWVGFLKGEVLDDFYCRSRILVFPGKWFEGFPNVITHAMAGGRAVIASRLGGVPEIVAHDKTGLLFEPGNVSQLCETISWLYRNPDLCARMGEAGRIKAEKEYSPGTVYEKWMALFKDAIAKK